MGSKGKERRSGRAIVKAEEKRRRREEAKEEIKRAQAERIALERETTATHPLPKKYD